MKHTQSYPELQQFFYFPSSVSIVSQPEFLDTISIIAQEKLEKSKKLNPELNDVYPVRMTESFFDDSRAIPFSEFVAKTSWDILTSQGYATNSMGMFFTEMWVQEHHKHSLMEQHVHGFGSQIIGFYFLNAPENCSRVLFHDPRPGKVQLNLPEKDFSQVTYGSNMVNFVPEPGMLMFANAWLPHSFSRHSSDEPLRFVHFNLNVDFRPVNNVINDAEVI
jgi:hypothetical protein